MQTAFDLLLTLRIEVDGNLMNEVQLTQIHLPPGERLVVLGTNTIYSTFSKGVVINGVCSFVKVGTEV